MTISSKPDLPDSPAPGLSRRLLGDMRAWCRGRWWQWRVPLLFLLGWDARRHLQDPDAAGLFGGITFGVHEFGHLVFAFLGQFMAVAGGSLAQILLPLAAGALLAHHRDYFGVGVAGVWLGSSLIDLARYIGDARTADLDLVGFGEDPQHDWTWLLSQFHALQYDTRLAAFTRGAGVLVLGLSLLFGIWLCLQMATRQDREGT